MFFDLTKTPFLYEPEGFSLNRIKYLPDFYLPHLGYWVEVKGKPPTDEEKHKGFLLTQATRKPIIFLSGHMGFNRQNCSRVHTYKTEIIYGFNRPHPQYDSESEIGIFSMLFEDDPKLVGKNQYDNGSLYFFLCEEVNARVPDNYTGSYEDVQLLIESDCEYYLKEHGIPHPKWKYGYSSSSHNHSPFWGYMDGKLVIRDESDGEYPDDDYDEQLELSNLKIGGYLNKVACHSFK